jgi:hypothetical protein
MESIMSLDSHFFDGPANLVQEKIHSWNCARREAERALCFSAAVVSRGRAVTPGHAIRPADEERKASL